MDRQSAAITSTTFTRWLLLGLPAILLWAIGGFGALSLLCGLVAGSVDPGTGSSAISLGMMWGTIVLCAFVGIALGMGSLVLPFRKPILAANVLAGFFSLFFSVLAAS